MGSVWDIVAAARSIGTAGALGLLNRHPGRLAPLDVPPVDIPAVPDAGAQADEGLDTASMVALRDRLATGGLTSHALTCHVLARIGEQEGALNSLISINPDVLAEARRADERRAAGEPLGPLHGVPVTVKDNIETAGPLPTTAGAEILCTHTAEQDAPVVAALRAAGAVIVGKANLSELAGAMARTPGFSTVGGQSVNPYGSDFTPGGSSSGSAVGVASGMAIASVGTETSGSLLAPAAFNGVVGMKPSRDLVDSTGVVPLVRFQDSPGPLARTVADAGLLLQAIAAAPLDLDLSPGALDGVRVGVLTDAIRAQPRALEDTSDNPDMIERIEDGLQAAGAHVADAVIVSSEPMSTFDSNFMTVILGGVSHDTLGYLVAAGAPVETLADLHAYNLAHPRRRMPAGQFWLSLALIRGISLEAYEDAALSCRETAAQILDATFETAGTDVLVSLSNVHSSLYATAGYPAVTVPLGLRASGMPTGASFIGRQGQDGSLLAAAYAFEQASLLRRAAPRASR